jgi:AcrR family transcriptional regulator
MKNINLELENFSYYEPTQVRAKLTFKRIFATSMRIIEEEGIDALNTNRVADDCKINISTLYHYFSNKDTIVYALYKTWFDSVAAVADAHRAGFKPGLSRKKFYRDLIVDILNIDGFTPKAAVALEQATKVRTELAEYDRLITEASISGYIEDLRMFGATGKTDYLILPASHILTTVWGAISIGASYPTSQYPQVAEYSAEMIAAVIKRAI